MAAGFALNVVNLYFCPPLVAFRAATHPAFDTVSHEPRPADPPWAKDVPRQVADARCHPATPRREVDRLVAQPLAGLASVVPELSPSLNVMKAASHSPILTLPPASPRRASPPKCAATRAGSAQIDGYLLKPGSSKQPGALVRNVLGRDSEPNRSG